MPKLFIEYLTFHVSQKLLYTSQLEDENEQKRDYRCRVHRRCGRRPARCVHLCEPGLNWGTPIQAGDVRQTPPRPNSFETISPHHIPRIPNSMILQSSKVSREVWMWFHIIGALHGEGNHSDDRGHDCRVRNLTVWVLIRAWTTERMKGRIQ